MQVLRLEFSSLESCKSPGMVVGLWYSGTGLCIHVRLRGSLARQSSRCRIFQFHWDTCQTIRWKATEGDTGCWSLTTTCQYTVDVHRNKPVFYCGLIGIQKQKKKYKTLYGLLILIASFNYKFLYNCLWSYKHFSIHLILYSIYTNLSTISILIPCFL